MGRRETLAEPREGRDQFLALGRAPLEKTEILSMPVYECSKHPGTPLEEGSHRLPSKSHALREPGRRPPRTH